jgi:hypothetical protein
LVPVKRKVPLKEGYSPEENFLVQPLSLFSTEARTTVLMHLMDADTEAEGFLSHWLGSSA